MTIAAQVILVLLLAVAVTVDLRARKIPNWLTVAGATAGLMAGAAGGGPAFVRSLQGLGAGFAVGLVFFTFFRSGGGDAKLLTAVGAIAGPSFLLWTALYGAIAGLPMALWLMWRRGVFAYTLHNLAANSIQRTLGASERRLDANNRAGYLHYSLAIATGCAIAWLVRGW